MNKKNQQYFFILAFTLVATLSFFVFRPFLASICAGAFLAVLFYPWFKRLKKMHFNNRLSAILVVTIVFILVTIPLFFFSAKLVGDSQRLYAQFQDPGLNGVEKVIVSVEDFIGRYSHPSISIDLASSIESVAGQIVRQVGGLLVGTVEAVFYLILIIFFFYYFLINGEHIKKELAFLSPLPQEYNSRILSGIQTTINSVLKGALLVALIQGILAGIGLWLFQVPSPIIWGSLGVFAALVPGIGTGLVTIPAIAYLFLTQQFGYALGLLIWSTTLVALADNVLIPYFYGKNMKAHPVFV